MVEKAKRHQGDLQVDFEKNKSKLDRAVSLGNAILGNADSAAVGTLKHWIGALSAGWQEVNAWIDQLGDRIKVGFFILTPPFPVVTFDNFGPSRTHCSTQG